MSEHFFKVATGLDVAPLRAALQAKPHLFDAFTRRADSDGSPHYQAKDIWLRYNDNEVFEEVDDYTDFNDEHDSVWYPAAFELPEVMPIVFSLMRLVNGERLGGVLLTKLPPGGRIEPHIDPGWHAGYYHKFYVPILNAKGSLFRFEDGDIDPDDGDAWFFNNQVTHWVENNTDSERISLIVCIKTHSQSMRERLEVLEQRLDRDEQPTLTIAEEIQKAIADGSDGADIEVEHHFSDGLYSKEIRIPKGKHVLSHAHTYSHLSFLSKGRVVVSTDEDPGKIYRAGACINIPAGVHHAILALEDAVWFCTHATSETDLDKIDGSLIQGD